MFDKFFGGFATLALALNLAAPVPVEVEPGEGLRPLASCRPLPGSPGGSVGPTNLSDQPSDRGIATDPDG